MVIKKQSGRMSRQAAMAGRRAWARSGTRGRLGGSSADFERAAQKTWIQWVDASGGERRVIECELYMQPRASGGSELVGMLHGMCPCCGETFIVREDNKEMSIGATSYDRAPKWLKIHWRHHLAEKHGLKHNLALETLGRLPGDHEMVRPPTGSDPIPVISGTNRVEEPWVCDYCKRWGVYVYEGVARDMNKAPDRIIVASAGARPSRSDRSAPGAIEV